MIEFGTLPEAVAAAQDPANEIIHIEAGSPVKAYQAGDALPSHCVVTAPTAAELAWEAIKAHRDRLSDAGGYAVTVGGVTKWFHSDAKSKTQQLALSMMGASVPAVQWKTMDGSFVTMTQAWAYGIFNAAAAQDMAIFAAAEAHRAAMLAAPDPAAYDFSAGWPATFGA